MLSPDEYPPKNDLISSFGVQVVNISALSSKKSKPRNIVSGFFTAERDLGDLYAHYIKLLPEADR